MAELKFLPAYNHFSIEQKKVVKATQKSADKQLLSRGQDIGDHRLVDLRSCIHMRTEACDVKALRVVEVISINYCVLFCPSFSHPSWIYSKHDHTLEVCSEE